MRLEELKLYEVIGRTQHGTYAEVVEAVDEEDAKAKALPLLESMKFKGTWECIWVEEA